MCPVREALHASWFRQHEVRDSDVPVRYVCELAAVL